VEVFDRKALPTIVRERLCTIIVSPLPVVGAVQTVIDRHKPGMRAYEEDISYESPRTTYEGIAL